MNLLGWTATAFAAAPVYKAHEEGLKGHASAFDDLWAARGFARRYQCRFTTRRRVREAAAAVAPVEEAEEGEEGDGGAKRRRKETSRQRKKRRARERAEEEV